MTKKKCRQIYKNHPKSNNYKVCTAVAHCSPNILDAIVLENMNFSKNRIGPPALWSTETELDFCHESLIYASICVYFNYTLIHMSIGLIGGSLKSSAILSLF
jgi:hypothetical protein